MSIALVLLYYYLLSVFVTYYLFTFCTTPEYRYFVII